MKIYTHGYLLISCFCFNIEKTSSIFLKIDFINDTCIFLNYFTIKMSLKDLLENLDALSNSLTCPVCSKLCTKPITFSKCLHTICTEHYKSVNLCPICKKNVKNCINFEDNNYESLVECTRELQNLCKDFKVDNSTEKLGEKERKGKKRAIERQKDQMQAKHTKSSSEKSDSHDGSEISTADSISLKHWKILEKRNSKGETPLHIACRIGNIEKVIELLDQGANPNTKDNASWTPLHEVVQNGRLDILKILIDHNALVNVPGQANESPLHEAVRFHHNDIIRELIKCGADLNVPNSRGETPYQLATGETKMLLEKAIKDTMCIQSLNINKLIEFTEKLDSQCDIHIYCVAKSQTVHNKLKTLVSCHCNMYLETKFSDKVTHLIVDTDESGTCCSTLEILQGIVNSIWILTVQWVMMSTKDKLEEFRNYEVIGVGSSIIKGPKKSRYNKYKQLPGIFNCCHFYFHNFNKSYKISEEIVIDQLVLAKLVTNAGGIVLKRAPNPEAIPDNEKLAPYHAKRGGKLVECSHYIIFKDIYEPMYNMKHLKALPIGWFIECIEKYKLCEPWLR